MKFFFIIVLMLIISDCVRAQSPVYGNVIVQDIVSIYDADTFKVNIKGWPDIAGKRISIRVSGVDAAELRTRCDAEKKRARAAKKFTVVMLRTGRIIELRNMKRGKYFRIVADVFIDGKSLEKALIKNGHAVAYFGGTKTTDWCMLGA